MEPNKKTKVLKKYYQISVGDKTIKIGRAYKATEIAQALITEGYTVTLERVEKVCEMTQNELEFAHAHDAEVYTLSNDFAYNPEPVRRNW